MAFIGEHADIRDEDWIVNQARSLGNSDVSAAKSWLIVGRTLFPRNFSIQFEMYQLEKRERRVREAAKLFEEMAVAFYRERLFWVEISSMTAALQSDSSDQKTVYLRELFNALPSALQCSMLISSAEASTDTLSQCRLLMLVVDRYPNQVSDQGVKLVELLLQAEKIARCQTPVNCYRKYLACDVLPLLLRCGVQAAVHRPFFSWLEKVIEFYTCYITQSSSFDVVSGGGKSRPVVIDGLSEKESNITEPWNQLCQLMQMVASQLQWKTGKMFNTDSCEFQLKQLNAIYDSSVVSLLANDSGSHLLHHQLFYGCLILFLRSIHCYMAAIQPGAVGVSSHDRQGLVLVEACKVDVGGSSYVEHRSKKLKVEPEFPSVVASESIPSDTISNFTTGFRCWQLLQGDAFKNDFSRLCQQWSAECWVLLRYFEIDACICEGLYQDALMKLQSLFQSLATSNAGSYIELRMNLQMACCFYQLGNYAKSCQLVLDIIAFRPARKDQPSVAQVHPNDKPAGRQLQLLLCSESDILSYSVCLLIACLKDKAMKVNMTDDLLLGHMIVLMQFNWPVYENLFCDIVRLITKHGKFTYNLFFTYIVNIDMLEEFAYIWTQGVKLDILPTSAKGTAQARTVTRGVNKTVKEDLKIALEKQVSRSHENVISLLRLFLLDEAELLKQNLTV